MATSRSEQLKPELIQTIQYCLLAEPSFTILRISDVPVHEQGVLSKIKEVSKTNEGKHHRNARKINREEEGGGMPKWSIKNAALCPIQSVLIKGTKSTLTCIAYLGDLWELITVALSIWTRLDMTSSFEQVW